MIQLRGVAVHNLKKIDLDIPHRSLIVVCGPSGSGKTSLSLDTLYAEGQRRYLETYSASARQFLERLDKPEADRIDGIPASIAVRQRESTPSARATVGTATEILDFMQLAYARIGKLRCPSCGTLIRPETPYTATARLMSLAEGTRFIIAFPRSIESQLNWKEIASEWRESGWVRAMVGERLISLSDGDSFEKIDLRFPALAYAVVDRLVAGAVKADRVRDSLELGFKHGAGRCAAFISESNAPHVGSVDEVVTLEGLPWRKWSFNRQMRCENCALDFIQPEPSHFNFNHGLGACPTCEGLGTQPAMDLDLIIPDRSKSLRDGAIVCWSGTAQKTQLNRLFEVAVKRSIRTDIPVRDLSEESWSLILHGDTDLDFGGLDAFLADSGAKKTGGGSGVRASLAKFMKDQLCPTCHGARLRKESLLFTIGGLNFASFSAQPIEQARLFIGALLTGAHGEIVLDAQDHEIASPLFEQVNQRLAFLSAVGLGYLSLDRSLRTLSRGEAQRVTLTTALGSNLVNLLYVLDEPTVGLHPHDLDNVIVASRRIRDRGNTVVVVEHEETMIRAADHVIELGPAAGERGGKVVFQGRPNDMESSTESLTGAYMAGRRGVFNAPKRRPTQRGWIRLVGARGHNLKNLSVDFPLGVLCVVTGVSGAGKSTLVQDTLYGALCRRKYKPCPAPLPYDDVLGDGQIEDVIRIDQEPIGRSVRSNPATYIKAFDEIRKVFADTTDAKTQNYSASHFSFNQEEGRCNVCEGEGFLTVDMQFLADITMKCPQCRGARYREEILRVRYRSRSIADVLDMTVRDAFSFFRGQPKTQAQLKRLIDVGLDYVRLGQPLHTLSSGEAQRLRLAAHLAEAKKRRTLILLDEPTTGLHFVDVVQILDCFESLLEVGHSLIVVEHNLQLLSAADYIIDLGPGAAEQGGEIVCQGTPEEVAQHDHSLTGRFLATELKKKAAQLESLQQD